MYLVSIVSVSVTFEYFSRLVFLIFLILIAILTVSFIIIKLIKKPSLEPNPPQQQGLFNNMTHNPALLNGLQIVFVVALLLVVSVPAAYLKAKGPNAFILRAIVNQVNQLNLVIPFYAFNKKLRKYAWKETKSFFGLNNQIQDLPPQPARF